MNSWFENMDKITIFMGLAIIYLGLCDLLGVSTIPPALVTGISISGFCLTFTDFMEKIVKERDNKFLNLFTSMLSSLLYFFAAASIVCFPYLKDVTSLSDNTLEKMSTIASVIALGFVFVSIGYNNKREALKDAEKRTNELKGISQEVQETLAASNDLFDRIDSVSDTTKNALQVIEKKDKKIKELKQLVNELQEKNTNPPV
ncbi:hypothetical protein [Bacillus cereus]|uniref:hypothetical protein n=1 Tax=Bacillus cereus TaxID=1396 RepID=UPI00240E8EC0|nr:hypothetical protein [Bacillus cereus]MDG1570480.1 hypothetical protein [Bacillus cereus]